MSRRGSKGVRNFVDVVIFVNDFATEVVFVVILSTRFLYDHGDDEDEEDDDDDDDDDGRFCPLVICSSRGSEDDAEDADADADASADADALVGKFEVEGIGSLQNEYVDVNRTKEYSPA